MIKELEIFYEKLDNIMLQCMHSRIILYGYGYSGRYIKWYAKYWHGIDIDYIISLDMRSGQAYDNEIFRQSLLAFDYKDTKDAIVWITERIDKSEEERIKNKKYNFYKELYEEKESNKITIQPLGYCEYVLGCDFLTAVDASDFKMLNEHSCSYRVTTEKELFPLLDMCHCKPKAGDSIFDFGCGKGGAMVSFLNYGFENVGGVELQKDLFETACRNIKLLRVSEKTRLIEGDAREIKEVLDDFNWFYFFQPFDGFIMETCINNIRNSIRKKNRRIRIIVINPFDHQLFLRAGFTLFSQFTIDTRQRVVMVFTNQR